jgi:hypothetical protein
MAKKKKGQFHRHMSRALIYPRQKGNSVPPVGKIHSLEYTYLLAP